VQDWDATQSFFSFPVDILEVMGILDIDQQSNLVVISNGTTTPSFVVELPLVVDSKQESELNSKFQAGRKLYNACLNEALVRMDST